VWGVRFFVLVAGGCFGGVVVVWWAGFLVWGVVAFLVVGGGLAGVRGWWGVGWWLVVGWWGVDGFWWCWVGGCGVWV